MKTNLRIEENEQMELLKFSINRLDSIISNADNKASFLLSFVSAVSAGLWLIKKDLFKYCLSETLIYFCFALFFISICLCFYVLWPRSRGKIFGLKGKNSILHFESLKKGYNGSHLPQNEKDFTVQMKALSIIISRKLIAIRISLISSFIGTLSIFFVMISYFSSQQ